MKGRFLLSTFSELPDLKDAWGHPLPEAVLAGRSNVGKSSLINHLLDQKNLAKVSATPGKTQLLNFFLIDDRFLLVDLPGYGFAKAPRETVQKWSNAIQSYLNRRSSLRLILLLVDSRREVSEEDQSLIDWAENRKVPLLLIFTKTDKLSRAKVEALMQKYPDSIPYSTASQHGRYAIQKRIESILWG